MLLVIQCSRIHHRLGGVVATEHYEQVADHGSLLVVVQLDYFLLAQFLNAIFTIETAPSTIFSLAEMMAEAC